MDPIVILVAMCKYAGGIIYIASLSLTAKNEKT